MQRILTKSIFFVCAYLFRLAQIAQIANAVAIQFTFGLQYFVPMDILWRKFSPRIPEQKHNVAQISMRSGCILIMGVVAIIVPSLNPFIGLVGGIFFSFLGEFHSVAICEICSISPATEFKAVCPISNKFYTFVNFVTRKILFIRSTK